MSDQVWTALLHDGDGNHVRIDGAALTRVARELWRQDYGNGVSFPDAGRRHSLYLNKARAALTALNPSPEEK